MTIQFLYIIIILVPERNKLSIVDLDLLLVTYIMTYSDANCQKTPYVHADIQQKHQSISYYVVPLIVVLEIKPLVNQTRTKEISIDSYLETTSYIWKLMRLFLLQYTIFCVTPTACKSVKVQISEFVHDTSTCFNPLPLCVSLSNQYL